MRNSLLENTNIICRGTAISCADVCIGGIGICWCDGSFCAMKFFLTLVCSFYFDSCIFSSLLSCWIILFLFVLVYSWSIYTHTCIYIDCSSSIDRYLSWLSFLYFIASLCHHSSLVFYSNKRKRLKTVAEEFFR